MWQFDNDVLIKAFCEDWLQVVDLRVVKEENLLADVYVQVCMYMYVRTYVCTT